MKHISPARLSVIFLFLLAALVGTGCKENILINSKVSPASNTIGLYDTSLACITHTFYDDSALTSLSLSGISVFEAVGGLTDPFFGTMTAATNFQVIPLDLGYQLYDSAIIDSAILVLPYSGFTYGDTANKTITQTYQVYYLGDSLSSYTSYYSFSSVPVGIPLSDPKTVNVHSLIDTMNNFTEAKNYPGLRIKLKTPVITSLLKGAQSALNGSTTPFADFIKNFRGVSVRLADSRQTTSAIPYFQLDGANIYAQGSIHVYYRRTNVGSTDTTLIEPYYFDKNYCAHFNSVKKSYAHYPVNNLFNSTSANDQVIALQNLPGATFDITIPGITHLPNGIINKAELQLTLLPGYGNKIASLSDSQLLVPQKVYATGVGNGTYPAGIISGLTYTLNDYFPIGSSGALYILDGYLHNYTRNGKVVSTFTIDIPREVMGSIRANNDVLHLHINGTSDYFGAYHLVAGGGNYPDTLYRPKLFVVYSKLSN